MKVLVKSVLDSFPQLTYCNVLDKSNHEKELSSLKESNHNDAVVSWISWFSEESEPFECLRIRLSSDCSGELIFKRVADNHYLVVHNELENVTRLLNYLSNIQSIKASSSKPVVVANDEEPSENPELDLKMKDAMRIQKMIMPKDVAISKKFRKFFAVHEQQDLVGGDFYWYQETPNGALISLIDCTGHSVEGAMASMVCNSLLNQAYTSFDPSDISDFVSDFYDKFNEYNDEANEVLNYGIGAEMALYYFDYKQKEVKIASTGISAFLKKKDGVELLKARKIIDYTKVREAIEQVVISMDDISGIYAFTDGLTDQFDSNDRKKLGYKGVRKMIESESDFGAEYYSGELNKWMGKNMQYDDITLLGLAI